MDYPIIEMTDDEYNKLPEASSLEPGYLETADLGFRFITIKSPGKVGEIVKGEDMPADQIGACLAPPERDIKWMLVKRIRAHPIPKGVWDYSLCVVIQDKVDHPKEVVCSSPHMLWELIFYHISGDRPINLSIVKVANSRMPYATSTGS